MSEDLANILYESSHQSSQDKSATSPPSTTTSTPTAISSLLPEEGFGGWLSLGGLGLSSLTSSALRLADDLSQTLVVQAEQANAQLQREFSKTKGEKEQQAQGRAAARHAALPWETADEREAILGEELMRRVLRLSLDDRNFTEPPRAAAVQALPFAFQTRVPVILRLLELDAGLKSAHARLAPRLDEEALWRHYFARVAYLRACVGMHDDQEDDTITGRLAEIPEQEVAIYWPDEPAAFLPAATTPHQAQPPAQVQASSTGRGQSSLPSTPTPNTSQTETRTPVRTVGSELLRDIEDAMESPDLRPRPQQLRVDLRPNYIPHNTSSSNNNVGTPRRSLDAGSAERGGEHGYVVASTSSTPVTPVTPVTPAQQYSLSTVGAVRKEEEEDGDLDLDDLDLDDLGDLDLDLDEYDEDDLEAEIERELLDHDDDL